MNKKVKIVKVAYANDKGTRVWVCFVARIKGESVNRFVQVFVPAHQRTREELDALIEAETEVYVATAIPAVDEVNSKYDASAYCFEMIG